MFALISFLAVVIFSIISVKLGSIALEATGLSKDIASFQAQSAFSGVGFTTHESETVMINPIRRNILKFLMLIGSAGLTTAIATLIITFVGERPDVVIFGRSFDVMAVNIVSLILGIFVIVSITSTKYFDEFIRWILTKPLHRIRSKIKLYDYEKILGLSEGFTIGSFEVPKHNWMVNKTIKDLELEKEGVIVLGIYREVDKKDKYLGIPSSDFKIHNKDKIMVYCAEEKLLNLAKREKGAKGTIDRQEAVEEQKEINAVKKLYEHKLTKAAEEKKD